MRCVSLFIALTLLLLLAGCSRLPADYKQNKDLWESENVSNYSYKILITERFALPEITVVVHNKTEVAWSGHSGTLLFLGSPSSINNVLTIELLFERLERFLREEGRRVEVSYDPVYGFPARVTAKALHPPVPIPVSQFTITGFMVLSE